jgi:prepilin-type processing-associated H-X9-DG protein
VPPSGNFPTVHFRHSDRANVVFLDGHVESYQRKFAITVPGDNWMTQEQADRMDLKRLGYVCDGAADDTATRDALYDLE